MSTGRLLFAQAEPLDEPAVKRLLSDLETLGFLGPPIAPGEAPAYFTGDRFMQLVSFMGCSPFLKLRPDEEGDDDFCRIRVLGPYAAPRLVTGTNTRPPRCPACRRPVEAWRELAGRWEAGEPMDYNCPACGAITPFGRLEWRQNGGAGRLFIEVSRIFPGEAVPVPALMDRLGHHGGAWSYFYVQG